MSATNARTSSGLRGSSAALSASGSFQTASGANGRATAGGLGRGDGVVVEVEGLAYRSPPQPAISRTPRTTSTPLRRATPRGYRPERRPRQPGPSGGACRASGGRRVGSTDPVASLGPPFGEPAAASARPARLVPSRPTDRHARRLTADGASGTAGS